MFKIILKISTTLVICLLLYMGLLSFIRCNRLDGFANITFITNLERLRLATIEYADNHSGKLPYAQNWADLLMSNQKLVLRQDLANHRTYPAPGIFYNKSVASRSYKELKNNYVLFFEGRGAWNAFGDKETFYNCASKVKQLYLVTLGGDVYIYNTSSGKVLRLKDDVYIESKDLLWE